MGVRDFQLQPTEGRPGGCDRYRNQRAEQPNVGDNSGQGWRCLRGGLHRSQSLRPVAGSRVISIQKANTGIAFSLDSSSSSNGSGQPNGLSLSSANLYSAVQPGGSLFGLQLSNPVDTEGAYGGPSSNYGTAQDPAVGDKVGGINVFGGGLALYGPGKKIVGGVGVSGDTSCADHNIAWRVRNNLGLDHLSGVGGVSGDPARLDNIIFDIAPNPYGGTGISAGGFGHPTCLNTSGSNTLPPVQP
jgi:Haem-degrading